jgi:hypothetical protein
MPEGGITASYTQEARDDSSTSGLVGYHDGRRNRAFGKPPHNHSSTVAPVGDLALRDA